MKINKQNNHLMRKKHSGYKMIYTCYAEKQKTKKNAPKEEKQTL